MYTKRKKPKAKQTFVSRPTLKAIVAKINSKNMHPEFDWGKRVGKEIV
ncbi:MAG TPA: hypothetical protein VI953_04935 [Candidatus Paceibacterota bacterium]